MNICVYAASSDTVAPAYLDAAQHLGFLLGARGHTLVFGGGQNGLMGACARGAASAGGDILGVAPRFFDEPGVLFPGCTRFLFTETMRERKQIMEEQSEAFLILPGGIGTFEEFFETLTLKQLGRHQKPMALLNTLGYYDAMLRLLEQAAADGFMSQNCLRLFGVCSSPEEALAHIQKAETFSGSIRRLKDYAK